MFHVRSQRKDDDGWVAEGCEGWDWASIVPYLQRAESNARGADAAPGGDGPLQVSDPKEIRPMSCATVEAAKQLQHRERADFNDGDTEGCGFHQMTRFHDARDGERRSAAVAKLVLILNRPNLTVFARAGRTGMIRASDCVMSLPWSLACPVKTAGSARVAADCERRRKTLPMGARPGPKCGLGLSRTGGATEK